MEDEFARYANEIIPGLYLGSEESGQVALSSLQERSIGRILIPANTGCEGVIRYPDHIKYLQYNIPDVPSFPLGAMLDEFCDFIEQGRENQSSVLVHCAQGKSRSATVVIAYLMWKQNVSFREAMHLVRSKRPMISSKFEDLLLEWEERPLDSKRSVRHRFCKTPMFQN